MEHEKGEDKESKKGGIHIKSRRERKKERLKDSKENHCEGLKKKLEYIPI